MMDKDMIPQLSAEIQERVSLKMETCKMQRMEKFATDGKIDATNLMAFVLSEAKLYTTLFTTELMVAMAEYEAMEQAVANGETLKLSEEESEVSEHPLEMDVEGWNPVKVGDEEPEGIQYDNRSALEILEEREAAMKAAREN